MKVKKLMTKEPGTCSPGDTLSCAASVMWHRDCGIVPVVEDGRLVSVITDRDIAMAAAIQNKPVSEIPVCDVAKSDPVTCSAGDKVEKALKLMRKNSLRRLPVVDGKGGLVGIISIADVLAKNGHRPLRRKALKTLTSVSQNGPIFLREV